MKRFEIAIVALLLVGAFSSGATYVFNRVYIRFDEFAVGSMVWPPDGRGTFASFKASDGVRVDFDRFRFPSADAARAAFQEEKGRSTKIIEQEVLYDPEGKTIVGERVIEMFPMGDGSQWPMMISVDGKQTLCDLVDFFASYRFV